ncbi:hypothetical protein [Bacillus cereus]|uniref:hypothetical protein n=1 Tax=Bacillus cereus TaxID=1396 RepID=UPI0024049AC6|nr:hypothetical protein [Bacillus cereus]
MKIILKKGGNVKGKRLRDAKALLFYLPVAKEDVLRYFSNEFNKKNSFTDFQGI